jgi:hypothetical protein
MKAFYRLSDALALGYHVWERTEFGYVVRIRTAKGYALALVEART